MKTVRLVYCFCLLLVSLLAIGLPGITLAQDEEEPAVVEKITLTPTYPTVESVAGGDFEFLGRFRVRLVCVYTPKLHRIESRFPRKLIDLLFVGKGPLRVSVPSERARVRAVRVNAERVEIYVGHLVKGGDSDKHDMRCSHAPGSVRAVVQNRLEFS